MLPEQISHSDPAYTERVAQLAYRYWELRGSPFGSSLEDWYRAEDELSREAGVYGLLRFA
jgi:hypothetical protein